MAILEIRTDGEPALKKQGRKVAEVDDQIRRLACDMIETMSLAPGVGLAANQVGADCRLITIALPEGQIALINPTVTYKKGETIDDEGCLSFPGKLATVRRFQKIKVKAALLTGDSIELACEDFLARVLQHEIDHLNGITIKDRAEPMTFRNAPVLGESDDEDDEEDEADHAEADQPREACS